MKITGNMRGLYIHIPFCNNKCPYCSFYSETSFSSDVMEKYKDSLLKEAAVLQNKEFDTIYIGGGTPSVMPAFMLDDLISRLLKMIDYRGREFTIEANPESVNGNFLSLIKDSAVSRVSLGVQSTDDNVLKQLGRIHNSSRALKSAESIKNTGVDLNVDMIYDIPGVSDEQIMDTLRTLTGLEPSHISAYSYDSSDTGYLEGFNIDNTMYETVEYELEKRGYIKYEVSNFSKAGKESIHNSIYWQGYEYIGLGSSSHSMRYLDNGIRERSNHSSNFYDYISNPLNKENIEYLSAEESIFEDIMTGLRMVNGVNIPEVEKRFGKIEKNLIKNINKNIEAGLLEWKEEYLKTTKRGMLGLEYLSCSLLG